MKNIARLLFASLLCASTQSHDSCSKGGRANEIQNIGDETFQKCGIFDYTFIMNYASNSGKKSKIYGFRIQLSNDNSKRLKKMIALSPEEMEKINMLPKKEKEKVIAKWYRDLYCRMETDTALVDVLYEENNNESPIFYSTKHLCDPESHDSVSEGGFLTAFYIPGTNHHKDPIVVVHGGPGGDAVSMLPTAVELSQTTGRSVMVYTQRGCHGSGCSFDPGVDTFEQSAQDLGKAIDATRVLSKRDKVVVFGHSFGPNIVNEYLSKPEENKKVSSVIYVGPAPIDLVGYLKTIIKRDEVFLRDKDTIEKEKNPLVKRRLYRMGYVTAFSSLQRAVQYAIECFQSDQLNLLDVKTSYFQNSKNISTNNNWNLSRDFLKSMRNKKPKDILKTITQPTLIIHGEDDSIPQSNAQAMSSIIQNAQCVILKGTAHCPFDENPAEFYPVVVDFLNQKNGKQDVGNQNARKG
jgi:pimeloyl-ACP methyl ester carboxylesterase